MNKKIYLLTIAIVAIIIVCIYQTYAMFTKEATINNAVTLVADINFTNDITEYQTVELTGNDTKIVKATLTNTSTSTLNYKMWYQASDTNVEVGRLQDTAELPSGTIEASSSKDIYILINNNNSSSITFNIGAEFATGIITLGSEITEITAVLSQTLDLTGIKTIETYNTPSGYETFIAPITGEYQIQLWGASGGNISSYSGGKGAYTKGNIHLEQGETLYVYVGGVGTSSSGGYNGGGTISSNQANYGIGGGGATDIRLTSGSWNNQTSLNSRIMVAAGGGGANHRGMFYGEGTGGAGGALQGIDGISQNHTNSYGYGYGIGGSQIAGGSTFWQSASNTYGPVNGSFGQGGGTEISSELVQSAGGGGYYGGGGSAHGGAGGGSSYISGYAGCIAITSQTSTLPKTGCSLGTTNINCSYHYSGKKFTNTTIIAGNASMPTHDGTSTMTGNDGNGYAKINLYAPYLDNLETKTINLGTSVDLTSDVNCIDIGTGCQILSVNIENTQTLNAGTHTIKYTVADNNNRKFIYSRDLIVVAEQIQYRYRDEECGWYCIEYTGLSCTGGYEQSCDMGAWSGWSTTRPSGHDECQKRTCTIGSDGTFSNCTSPTYC